MEPHRTHQGLPRRKRPAISTFHIGRGVCAIPRSENRMMPGFSGFGGTIQRMILPVAARAFWRHLPGPLDGSSPFPLE